MRVNIKTYCWLGVGVVEEAKEFKELIGGLSCCGNSYKVGLSTE
jgi:hypothetical protein